MISGILEMAYNGNIEAMQNLVEAYKKNGDEANANKWETILASTKYAHFSIMSFSMSKLTAYAAYKGDMLDEAQEEWNKIREGAIEIIGLYNDKKIFIDAETYDGLIGDCLEASYGLAVIAATRDDNYEMVYDLLDGFVEGYTKGQTLLGVACFAIAKYSEALNHLRTVYSDREYAIGDKDLTDEYMYVRGMYFLAGIYREGLPGIVTADYEAAVDILMDTIEVTKEADYREFLITELNKYKKKLFGGYKYTG